MGGGTYPDYPLTLVGKKQCRWVGNPTRSDEREKTMNDYVFNKSEAETFIREVAGSNKQ